MPDRLIVLNKDEDTVSFVDVDSGATIQKIDVGHHPHEVETVPEENLCYVSNALEGDVSVIDTEAMEETERIEHPEFVFPHDIKVSPDRSKLYLASTHAHKVFIFERPSHDVVKVLKTGQRLSHMLDPMPDWSRVYVPNIGSNTLSVLNPSTDEIEMHVSVGKGPEGVSVHPGGEFLYVANQDENNLYVLSTEHHGVLAKHPIGTTPVRMVFSPDGTYAFVPNRESHDVSVIDTSRHWEIKRLPVGRWPGGVVFSPTGERAYVANNKTNDVSVIDVGTLKEIERFDVGIHPDGIGYLFH
ncbi:MAG: YncE family protein [Candidatus Bipolaricaulia bacterium]